jgi:hypothetical protein
VAEAAFIAVGGGEVGDELPLDLSDGAKDHLGDTHAGFYREGFIPKVDDEDLDFAAVVGVNGAWGVEDSEAMMQGEAAAGADLGFPARRDFYIESSRDEQPLARPECMGSRKVSI